MDAEPPLEGKGKFRSARDEVLYQISLEGWANESNGDVESPTGYFSRITITPEELREVTEAFSDTIEELGFKLTGSLVGFFLLTEDGQGFVEVDEFPDETALTQAYREREAEYLEWADVGELE